jgi:DNA-directed RNA polymerase beta subunit
MGGALRTGTMENDALAAHGVEEIVDECMRTESDPAWMWCCTSCDSITNVLAGNTYCVMCKKSNTGKRMPTVGFFQVLVQELAYMGIRVILPLKEITRIDTFANVRCEAVKKLTATEF